jgi:hemerythrin-like domain-containing protein
MTDPLTDLRLRNDLPPAIRALVDVLPRADWPPVSEMGQLTQFWLQRHMGFRDLLSMLQTETQGFLDGAQDAQRYGARLYRLAGHFIGQLHEHHGIEDQHYFPALTRIAPRLETGFELLEADHHSLDALLQDFTERTNAVLQGISAGDPPRDPAGKFLGAADAFTGFLNRHLTDEEDIIVPVLLNGGEEKLYQGM